MRQILGLILIINLSISITKCDLIDDSIDWVFTRNSAVNIDELRNRTLSFDQLNDQINDNDMLRAIVQTLVDSQGDMLENLQRNLQTAENTNLGYVRAINSALGADMLLVDSLDQMHIDTKSLEKVVIEKSHSLIATLFPQDQLKVLMISTMLQFELKNVFQTIEPVLERESGTLFIDLQDYIRNQPNHPNLRLRRNVLTSLVNTLVSALKSTISLIVSPIQSSINTTLTLVENLFLSLMTDASSSNSLLNSIEKLLNTIFQTLANTIENVRLIINNLLNNITGNSSSRKRREIEYYEDNYFLINDNQLLRNNYEEYNQNSDLILVRNRRSIISVAILSVVTLLWKIISLPLNFALKYIVDKILTKLITYIVTYLENLVNTLLISIINSIFPCISC